LADTLPQGDEWQAALINLNDGSVEGLAHRERPVISVQFHPEASPGPHDNSYLFDRFLDMIATGQQTPAVETR
jgi:carbamoyl-phosphate synthase small subunit